MSRIVFPFECSKHILNGLNFVKFTFLETNKYNLIQIDETIYEFVLIHNKKPYILVQNSELGLLYYFNKDNDKHYFIDQNNKIYVYAEIPQDLKNLYIIVQQTPLENLQTIIDLLYNVCMLTLDQIPINIRQAQDFVNKLNLALRMSCGGKYQLAFDYAYNLKDIIVREDISLVKSITDLFICLKLNDKCISTMQCLYIYEHNIYSLDIISTTNPKYEMNHFNILLRAISMLIVPHLNLNISHIFSRTYHPITAFLMFSMFKHNVYNTNFVKFLQERKIEVLDLNIMRYYIENIDYYIQIYSPINDENLALAKQIFNDTIKDLPCKDEHTYEKPVPVSPKDSYRHNDDELYESVEEATLKVNDARNAARYQENNKYNKYMNKLYTKFSDVYLNKLLHWNTKILYNKFNN